MAESIRTSAAFSESRAQMIANTEAARSEIEGNKTAWKESGQVASVNVVLSADHDSDDECNEAADGGPYSLDDAPDVPLHPNCSCSVVIGSLKSEDEV